MKISGLEEMAAEAARFVTTLHSFSDRATILALSGDLGAGKTSFAQGIAKALGVTESVTSPTFVLEKIYKLENQKFERLIHIDAYRLQDAHELGALGWDEITKEPQNLILIEWPENVAASIPATAARISLAGTDASRELIYG